jgi:RND family efflux transporter MFP subunit
MLLLSLSVLFAGCSAQSQTRVRENEGVPPANRIVVVKVFDVQPASNTTNGDLLIPAALSVENTAYVLSELEGRIINLSGEEGSRVAKGQILAQFNDEEQRGQLRQAELEIGRLKVEAQQLQALIKLNRSEFDRESLLASQGLVSKGEVERAQYKLEQSVQELEKNRLATESAVARMEVVKLEMQKTIVRAPVSGVITRRHISLGTNVARNDKLFEVAPLSSMELRFRVPQTSGSLLEYGQVLDLSTDDKGAVIAKARIKRRDPIADAISNTFGYVAEIVGNTTLMPGQTVYVHLPGSGDSYTSYWLPLAAFPTGSDLKNGAMSSVFVVNGEKVSTRSVVIKTIEGDQVQVEFGVTKDDRVVLAPPAGLKPGDHVAVSH